MRAPMPLSYNGGMDDTTDNIITSLRPGDILHVWRTGLAALLIRRCCKASGQHDAIILPPEREGGEMRVGESLFRSISSVVTPLADYAQALREGSARVAVLRFADATPEQGQAAAEWWLRHVRGRPYDVLAYPVLLAKSLLGGCWKWAAGLRIAYYCTEGVRDAWAKGVGPSFDVWHTASPTPGDTERALSDPGTSLADVTADCVTDPAHRLEIKRKDSP